MSEYSYSWPTTATLFAVQKEQTVAELTRSRHEWPISGDELARAKRE